MNQQIQNCITDVREWCTSRRLQLNHTKTELVWFGSRSNLTKLASSDCSLLVGGNNIKPSTTVRDLGVLLDSELSLSFIIGNRFLVSDRPQDHHCRSFNEPHDRQPTHRVDRRRTLFGDRE